MDYFNEIQIQTERKAKLLWWIEVSIYYTIGLLFSLVLIVGPVILLFKLWNLRVLLLFIMVPIGLWIMKVLLGSLGKRIWLNRHRSSYKLEHDQLSFCEWDVNLRTSKIDSVSFNSIDYVVSSQFILEDNYAFAKSKEGSMVLPKNLGSVLYVVYSNEEKLASIPFYPKESTINTWLKIFQEKDIPLFYVGFLVYSNYDDGKLACFTDKDNLVSYTFSGDWYKQIDDLRSDWQYKIEEENEEE